MTVLPVTQFPADMTLDAIEEVLLQCPQTECPVAHHFGPGVYIREATIPADTFVMGHSHKYACMNVLVRGKMALLENGVVRVVEAPMIFTTPPGRKFAYIIEEVVFQNIHATDETDVDTLEDMLVDKSVAWEARQIEQDTTMLLSAANKLKDTP